MIARSLEPRVLEALEDTRFGATAPRAIHAERAQRCRQLVRHRTLSRALAAMSSSVLNIDGLGRDLGLPASTVLAQVRAELSWPA